MSEPDSSRIEEIERKLMAAVKALRAMAPLVAAAKTVIEYDSERRKNALAAAQLVFINRGESVAGSESMARATPAYLDSMKQLKEQLQEAHNQMFEWSATMCSWETARSLLAQQRETMRTLQG